MAARERPVVAVDFGTTTSFVAERAGRDPVTIHPLHPVTGWMPSIAAYDGRRYVVGERAEDIPARLIRSVKRAITDKQPTVRLGGGPYGTEVPADNVIVAVLNEIRRRSNIAGRSLGRLKELRLGCPAMWDGEQRGRLLELAGRAGLPVSDATLIDEPVAAGVAWLAERYLKDAHPVEGRLLVFDMGGGTLDVAVLDVVGGERPDVRVLASLGTTVAGDRLDEAITDDLSLALAEAGFPLESFAQAELAAGMLRREAVAAKIALSNHETHRVVLPPYIFGRAPVLRYTRDQMEESFEPLMATATQLVTAALRAARLSERYRDSTYDPSAPNLVGDVDFVLLAGGMSRIPAVRRRLAELLPDAEFVSTGVEPDESIVAGLTDTAGYERINLHRPAFSFVLEWEGGAKLRTVYDAYTPLYEPWHLSTGRSYLGYERRGRDLDLPRSGRAYLRAISSSGRPVDLLVDGRPTGRIPVTFGLHDLVFKIYCDGTVSLLDGIGQQFIARVDRWPVVRGREDAQLKMIADAEPPKDPPTAWYLDKEYTPPSVLRQL